MTFLPGTGCHRVQFIYFFRGQIGPRTRSGIGLGSDSRLRRMRRCLVLPRELWIENFGKTWSRAIERKGPSVVRAPLTLPGFSRNHPSTRSPVCFLEPRWSYTINGARVGLAPQEVRGYPPRPPRSLLLSYSQVFARMVLAIVDMSEPRNRTLSN